MLIRILFLSSILFAAPIPAFAYVDPGIIGAITQTMYIFIFGFVSAWVMKPWRYLKSLLQRFKNPKMKQAEKSSHDVQQQSEKDN